jgi:hypothetical protein
MIKSRRGVAGANKADFVCPRRGGSPQRSAGVGGDFPLLTVLLSRGTNIGLRE